MEIKIDERTASVELINSEEISIDGKIYDANIIMVERGVYSILIDGKSYNVELFESGNQKEYLVNTFYHSYELEVIDAESKYLKSRSSDDSHQEAIIS